MKHTARIFSAAAVAFGLLFCHFQAEAQTRRPNIVVIVADDMGYADIGVHGSKDIPTPNIDSLARAGVRLTDAYVTGPYCSPTRAGLMTGKYPQRFGHEFNIGPTSLHADAGLPMNETTMADRLRAAGYHTGVFGKWHLGSAPRFHPLERGFDEFFGFLHGAHSYMGVSSPTNPLYDGKKTVTEPAYLTDVLADRAVDFVNRNRAKPFFLYLAFNAVHVPLQATDKYLKRFANIPDERRRTYAAMLSAMDDGIGKTLAALDPDNTIIFFFSDNGGPTTAGGVNGSSNAPLKGSKRTTWEGGIRVPFIVKWKGHLAAGSVYSQPMIQLDILPTALAAVGITLDPRSNIDGVNLLPFLTGKRSGRPHETLYWRLGVLMAIRKGDWKLVRMTENGFQEQPTPLTDLTTLELYNLKDDIGETTNLVSKQPKKVKELAADWTRWTEGLVKPGWPPPARGPGQ